MTKIRRTLAIGDIHGCLEPLKLLWGMIDPQPDDRIIFVGDYVDRGPDTKGVIDFLMGLQDKFDVTFLFSFTHLTLPPKALVCIFGVARSFKKQNCYQ